VRIVPAHPLVLAGNIIMDALPSSASLARRREAAQIEEREAQVVAGPRICNPGVSFPTAQRGAGPSLPVTLVPAGPSEPVQL